MFAKTRYTSLQSLRVVCLLVFANLLVAVGKDNDAAQSFGNNICGLFFFFYKENTSNDKSFWCTSWWNIELKVCKCRVQACKAIVRGKGANTNIVIIREEEQALTPSDFAISCLCPQPNELRSILNHTVYILNMIIHYYFPNTAAYSQRWPICQYWRQQTQ